MKKGPVSVDSTWSLALGSKIQSDELAIFRPIFFFLFWDKNNEIRSFSEEQTSCTNASFCHNEPLFESKYSDQAMRYFSIG